MSPSPDERTSCRQEQTPMKRHYPTSPAELTNEWLTQQLRTDGAITDSKVVGFRLSPVGEGIGMLGVLTKAELDYDQAEPGAPASVVAKFATPVEGNPAV